MSGMDPTVELDVGLKVDAGIPRSDRRRVPVLVVFSFAVLAVVAAWAIAGPSLAPHDPDAQNLKISIQHPGDGHLLGTDDFGRDVLSRIMAGARTAFVGPLVIALGAMLIGSTFGLLAGYRGGRTDAVVMRVVELVHSVPGLLLAIVVGGVLGGGYVMAVVLLTILFAPNDTRLIRAATLEQRPRPYVEAAEALGLSARRVMLRHIWPNVLPVIVANTFLTFAFALVSLAGLSFVGVGVDPSTSDWGRMLYDARLLIFQNPWTAIGPAVMIVLTTLSMNLLGDWLFEALSDRGKRR